MFIEHSTSVLPALLTTNSSRSGTILTSFTVYCISYDRTKITVQQLLISCTSFCISYGRSTISNEYSYLPHKLFPFFTYKVSARRIIITVTLLTTNYHVSPLTLKYYHTLYRYLIFLSSCLRPPYLAHTSSSRSISREERLPDGRLVEEPTDSGLNSVTCGRNKLIKTSK